MSEAEDTGAGLSGVPGLGPVRRRLLAEAGIVTHTDLATASVEQIISVTGMPRAAAEQALASVAAFATSEPATVVEETNDSSDEVFGEEPDPAEPLGEEAPQATRLEHAALRAQTAISDVSRFVEPGSRLNALLLRFVRFTDGLSAQISPGIRPRIQKRIAERIELINEHLEAITKKASSKKTLRPLGPKRAKKLEVRLRRTRDCVKRLLNSAAESAKKTERKSSSTA